MAGRNASVLINCGNGNNVEFVVVVNLNSVEHSRISYLFENDCPEQRRVPLHGQDHRADRTV